MSADPRDLTTVANLKAWLSLASTNTDVDAQIQRLVTAVSVGIQNWLSRDLKAVERTETYDGTGSDLLLLRLAPVTSVARVLVDGREVPAAAYRATPSALVRVGGWWPAGWGNVVVTYTAGYNPIPVDVEQACLELAALRWRERDRIGLASKGFGQETTTFITKDMPDSVRTALLDYRRVAPC